MQKRKLTFSACCMRAHVLLIFASRCAHMSPFTMSAFTAGQRASKELLMQRVKLHIATFLN